MKTNIIIGLLLLFSLEIFAQNNNAQLPTSINEDGTPPHSSAILDVQSSSKGMLTPRMTYTEIKNIASPAEGLMVYDTENHCLRIFNGSVWDCLYQKFGGAGREESVVVSGGAGSQILYGIDADLSGNIYIVGSYSGSTIFENTTLPNIGFSDVFVAKYNSSGGVEWVKSIGGSNGSDIGYSIAVSQNGDVFVTGSFRYNITLDNGNQLVSNGTYEDVFIVKYNTSGNLEWGKSVGGTSSDLSYAIDVDSNGDAYITGYFTNTITFGSDVLTAVGSKDIFIAKYSGTGVPIWAKSAGGTYFNYGFGLAIDNTDNIYLTGYFHNTASFGSLTVSSAGNSDIFLAQYDTNGNSQWVRRAGGGGIDSGRAIAFDNTGNIYLTGYYSDQADFNGTSIQSIGSADTFIAKYDDQGSLIWARRLGGGGASDTAYGIAINSNNNIYVTGDFQELAIFDNSTIESRGFQDIFIAKCDSNGNVKWVQSAGSYNSESGRSVTSTPSGDVYVGGFIKSIGFFGENLVGIGGTDIFIAKYNE